MNDVNNVRASSSMNSCATSRSETHVSVDEVSSVIAHPNHTKTLSIFFLHTLGEYCHLSMCATFSGFIK